ncbi:hypothetical protein AVEN_4404-1 [Araneus ventricosus]|uniref:Uncharacterized protein n=1 Tax=Araneus ventricosus TaxID=182803 RepID=A0A4Y2WEM7_ARAVE|nr:hypothetical protein AVEN_4404-1 [Araneus ventricosus]
MLVVGIQMLVVGIQTLVVGIQVLVFGNQRLVVGIQTLMFYGCYLQYRETCMTLLWLIPICSERRRIPFVRLLAIAASTCVDVPSSVADFDLPDLLTSEKEPALWNFMISFATVSWFICVLHVALKVRVT